MRVVRVVIEAPVTSFRHPFFVTGRQPTADFPPPSTIFGHCASALGEWPDPRSFFFGLHFTWSARGADLEHQHITTALGRRSRVMVQTPEGPQAATTTVTVQPVRRDFLFDVRMALYLPPEFAEPFRQPACTVVLGRSQDLAEVRSVDEVDLERPGDLRLEHTLLPINVRPCVRFGATVLLTRYIAPPPTREATFAQYVALREPVFLASRAESHRAFTRVEGIALDNLWCDPSVRDDEGYSRGVWIHRVVD